MRSRLVKKCRMGEESRTGGARLQPCRKRPPTLLFRPQQITARAVICGVEEPCVLVCGATNYVGTGARLPHPLRFSKGGVPQLCASLLVAISAGGDHPRLG